MTLPTGPALRDWLERPDAPRSGLVKLLVQRKGGGRNETPGWAELTRAGGLVGDRWARSGMYGRAPALKRQVTIMDVRVIELLLAASGGGRDLDRPGDNLVVDHATSLSSLPPGTRVRVGAALLELNDVPHLGCAKFEARFGAGALAWVNDEAQRDLRLRGIHGVVIEDGTVKLGDRFEVVR